MNKNFIKIWLPHIAVISIFALISMVYFYPLFSGKEIIQSDILQYKGMQREIIEHRYNFDEEPYWINNAFVGMPTYQITSKHKYDFLAVIDDVLLFLPRPANLLFLYMFFFYLFSISRKYSIPISFFGSLAYAFSSYYIIILMVGHNTKALTLAYAPLVFLGLFQVLFDKNKIGYLWLLLGLALQVHANHLQMTYYTLIMIIVIVLTWFINSYKKNEIKNSFNVIFKICFMGFLALILNAQLVLSTIEYTKQSTRGNNDVTINVDGSQKIDDSKGLSFDYITEYSYGFLETLTFFSPNIVGGSSTNMFSPDSEFVKFLRSIEDPETRNTIFRFARPYWGNQPIVAAPVYLGIVVLFFSLLGLISIKGNKRIIAYALIAISLLFSWGKNIPQITQFFIDFFPLYNKFRAVSSAQIIIMIIVPFTSMIGLNYMVKNIYSSKIFKNLIIVGTIFIVFISILIAGTQGMFSFTSSNEPFLEYPQIMTPLISSRAELINKDILNLIIYVSIIFILIYFFWKKKFSKNVFIILISIAAVCDLWIQNREYFDESEFDYNIYDKPFTLTDDDIKIFEDKSDFRVFEPSLGLSNSRTAYFHNTIGGYHGAKPYRLQNIYDFYLKKQDSAVMDMLNIKYVINNFSVPSLSIRKSILGSAWFVDELINTDNANEEILKLSKVDLNKIALSSELESKLYKKNINNKIKLLEKRNNFLSYSVDVNTKTFAVFSEIYYPYGWDVFIDGKKSKYHKVNYMLRGLEVDEGVKEITFKFNPKVVKNGTYLVGIGWILFFIFLIKEIKWSKN